MKRRRINSASQVSAAPPKDECEAEDVLATSTIDVKRSQGALADLIIFRAGVSTKFVDALTTATSSGGRRR